GRARCRYRLCAKEVRRLVEELIESRGPRQQHMIVSRQLDEARTRNDPGHTAALLHWCNAVALTMEHEGGDAYPSSQLSYVQSGVQIPKPKRVRGTRCDTLQFVKARRDLGRGIGHEDRREEVAKNRIG